MPTSAAIKKAALKKMSETCAQRLVPRLATYLFDGGIYAKHKVRKILEKGGYQRPWTDEARAVAILEQAGHKMGKFARTGTFVPASPTYTPPKGNGQDAVIPVIEDAATKLKRITILLMQGEKAIIREIKSGKRREIDEMSNLLLAALNEIRR